MKALFICGKARMRSPTAADLAGRWPGVQTDFAGLSNDADEKLGSEQLLWSDIIFVMEPRQAKRLKTLFPAELRDKKVVVLRIPDHFNYMDPELQELLTARLQPYLAP